MDRECYCICICFAVSPCSVSACLCLAESCHFDWKKYYIVSVFVFLHVYSRPGWGCVQLCPLFVVQIISSLPFHLYPVHLSPSPRHPGSAADTSHAAKRTAARRSLSPSTPRQLNPSWETRPSAGRSHRWVC